MRHRRCRAHSGNKVGASRSKNRGSMRPCDAPSGTVASMTAACRMDAAPSRSSCQQHHSLWH